MIINIEKIILAGLESRIIESIETKDNLGDITINYF